MDSSTEKLVIYARNTIPEKYVQKINELGATVFIEPWIYGEKEPAVSYDLTLCNIVLTLGLHDSLTILESAPNIQWVQSLSVGLDQLLHQKTIEHDLIITNTKGCTSIPIAEHTIAMITSLARGIPNMIYNQQAKSWEETNITELAGATVGIIGYGEIGKEIAKRIKGLELRVIGCRKRAQPLDQNDPADEVVSLEEIDRVLTEADFLVLALPSTKETLHLINEEKINKMKPTSYLINVGRGNTIVETDLIHALKTKKIRGAALDVFEVEPLPEDHSFWTLDNCLISPHTAYYSPKTIERYMDIFLENIIRFKKGLPLLNVVDKKSGY
ncbi:D-2-hydroxyacid dehydrogenase [Niallia sp. NCCP-28]|uniref:D-2-hydroxyacid dehydrogenase n=1 Tax=Niallia sp. NCCP-28 TaxID=2934712 RepID=UPI00208C45AA|nr:D-2-hydroxyacid dehydrogenase [Niallia sp. NCCP-28]GKU82790.1 3-phosphoglycerate dehydrogenase [Niallia sp. NCCP-28]